MYHVPVNFRSLLKGWGIELFLNLGSSAVPVGTCKPSWHWAGRCPEGRAFSKVRLCPLPALGASSFQELRTLHPGSVALPGSPPSVQTEAQRSSLNQPSAIATKNTMLSPENLSFALRSSHPWLRAFLGHLLVSALTNFNPQVSGRVHFDPLTQLTLQPQTFY